MNMNSEDKYCRLCAEYKHNSKQVDLQTNSKVRREITEKLTRINASTEFIDTKLPSTVCFNCIRALNRCYAFAVTIECAQKALDKIVSKIIVRNTPIKEPKLENDGPEHDKCAESIPLISESIWIETKINDTETGISIITSERARVGCDDASESKDLTPLPQLQHLQHTWENLSWLCTYCQTQFQSLRELQTHAIDVHSICNPYRCIDCKIRKQHLNPFILHVQKHKQDLKLSCYKCFERFKTAEETSKHIKTHVDTELSCPGCNSTFKTSTELKTHKDLYYMFRGRNNASIPSVAFEGRKCLICLKTYAKVKLHILRMHLKRQPHYICEFCGKGFYDKNQHTKHVTYVHTNLRPHICQICKLTYKTARELSNHTSIHYDKKLFNCDECGKTFRLIKLLNQHKISHTKHLSYKCNYCNKLFKRKSNLSNHILQHTREARYLCELCNRRFICKGNFNKHMKRRHYSDMTKKKLVPVDDK